MYLAWYKLFNQNMLWKMTALPIETSTLMTEVCRYIQLALYHGSLNNPLRANGDFFN